MIRIEIDWGALKWKLTPRAYKQARLANWRLQATLMRKARLQDLGWLEYLHRRGQLPRAGGPFTGVMRYELAHAEWDLAVDFERTIFGSHDRRVLTGLWTGKQ